MIQQINLYQPIFRKQKVVFSALAMVQVWGIVALMMTVIAGYTAYQIRALERQLAEARKYQSVTQGNVDKLKAQELAKTPSKLLESEVRRAQVEMAERRQVADLLSSGALSNVRGFSAQFEGLARQHAGGAWLTEISMREGGNWINLRGIALAPEIVPAYLRNLLAAEAFAGMKFNVLNLQASVDDPGRLWFEVGTAVKETAPAGAAPQPAGRPSVSGRQNDEIVGITRRTN
ncbi:MAG: hypothetical protein HYR49_07170 [Gammaproteobacteria bacterium]|nr:hypothetical protein [Gammaproteobacteria bacterium]